MSRPFPQQQTPIITKKSQKSVSIHRTASIGRHGSLRLSVNARDETPHQDFPFQMFSCLVFNSNYDHQVSLANFHYLDNISAFSTGYW